MVVRKVKLMDSERSREWRINGLRKAGFSPEAASRIEEAQTAKRILRDLDIPTVRDQDEEAAERHMYGDE